MAWRGLLVKGEYYILVAVSVAYVHTRELLSIGWSTWRWRCVLRPRALLVFFLEGRDCAWLIGEGQPIDRDADWRACALGGEADTVRGERIECVEMVWRWCGDG
jgi:hypothetical protein